MTTAEIAAPPVTRDVEDVLRERGLTRFHRKAILVTGAAWTFVAMEILLVGFVAPIFTNLWDLNGRMQGLVNSAALAGSLVGSLTLGRLADRIGRRAIFQYSILWYAALHRDDGPVLGAVVGDDVPLPRGARARRDARRRSLDALRVSAAAASRPTARLPRLLVAGRACCSRSGFRTSSSARRSTASATGAGATCSSPRRSRPSSCSSCAGRCPRARTSWRATDGSARRRRC